MAYTPESMRRLIFSLICSSRKAVNVPKPASVGITSSQSLARAAPATLRMATKARCHSSMDHCDCPSFKRPHSTESDREDDYRYDCLFPGYVSQSKRLS